MIHEQIPLNILSVGTEMLFSQAGLRIGKASLKPSPGIELALIYVES